MKKLFALLLVLLWASCAMAESVFDTAALRDMPDATVYTHPGTIDTVVRPLNQPYIGQVNEGYDGELVAFVDYITLPDHDVTLLRLICSTVAYEPITAQEMRLTVGGKRYTFAVSAEWEEYDGLYMEDHIACLTDESLPLLKAIAQSRKDDPIPVEFLSYGEVVFAGEVVIPGADAAELYDRFIDLNGKKQDLKKLRDLWPCTVENAK